MDDERKIRAPTSSALRIDADGTQDKAVAERRVKGLGTGSMILPADGRQSETALQVARGLRRLLRSLGFSSVTELPLASGRRADVAALGADGTFHIIEIKSSIADFRSDFKWRDYRLHCDKLYFAIPESVPEDIMPSDAGLIVADAYSAVIVRDAPEHRMAAATRRALLVRFGQIAADRLHGLADPESARGASI